MAVRQRIEPSAAARPTTRLEISSTATTPSAVTSTCRSMESTVSWRIQPLSGWRQRTAPVEASTSARSSQAGLAGVGDDGEAGRAGPDDRAVVEPFEPPALAPGGEVVGGDRPVARLRPDGGHHDPGRHRQPHREVTGAPGAVVGDDRGPARRRGRGFASRPDPGRAQAPTPSATDTITSAAVPRRLRSMPAPPPPRRDSLGLVDGRAYRPVPGSAGGPRIRGSEGPPGRAGGRRRTAAGRAWRRCW